MKKKLISFFLSVVAITGFAQESNRWLIEKKDGRVGFIDSTGREIFTGKYLINDTFHDGLVRFTKGRKYGFLDTLGNVVFWVKHSPVNFSEGLLAYGDTKGWCYLNTRGEKTIDLAKLEMPAGKEISQIFDFRNGRALVRIKDAGFDDSRTGSSCIYLGEGYNYYRGNWFYGFIDTTGQWAIQPVLESAITFDHGQSYVEKDGQHFFIDVNGHRLEQLLRGRLDDSGNFTELPKGLIQITYKGEILTGEKLDRVESFADGMAAVKIDGAWGFMDTTGQVVIEPRYYVSAEFSEGLAAVALHVDSTGNKGYWKEGFINKRGEVVLPFKKDIDFDNFQNGIARGRRFIDSKDGTYTGYYELFYINRNGKKIWSEVVKQ